MRTTVIFCDNRALGFVYNEITEDEHEDAQRKVEVSRYQSELLKTCMAQQHKYTCFHADRAPYTRSFDLEENEWTVKLFYSLPQYLPKNVALDCTYNKGSVFEDYQFQHSH